jgi:hypothetical protein
MARWRYGGKPKNSRLSRPSSANLHVIKLSHLDHIRYAPRIGFSIVLRDNEVWRWGLKMLGRPICRDFLARFLQTAFDGRSEGSIIVDDVYKAWHEYIF